MIIALDVETTGITETSLGGLVGMGCCLVKDDGTAFNEYYRYPEEKQAIQTLLISRPQAFVFHNAPYDIEVLKNHNIQINSQVSIKDTKLLAFLIDPDQELGLKPLALKYLGEQSIQHYHDLMTDLQGRKLKKSEMHLGDPVLLSEYCKEDCRNTLALYDVFNARLLSLRLQQIKLGRKLTVSDYYLKELLPVEKLLEKINRRGVAVDVVSLQEEIVAVKEEIKKSLLILEELARPYTKPLLDKLHEKEKAKRKTQKGKDRVPYPQFNFDSVAQVADLFLNLMGLRPFAKIPKTPGGKDQLSEPVLEEIKLNLAAAKKHPDRLQIVTEYLKYKALVKYLGTYLEGFLERMRDGRIYPQYLQVSSGKFSDDGGGTSTGRLSCRNPNLQNLPRGSKVKRYLVPDSGAFCFVYADYSQIELRLAAAMSKDSRMVSAFVGGTDLHIETANAIVGHLKEKIDPKQFRQIGKTCNFLLIYGGSWRKLQAFIKDATGILLEDDTAKAARDKFFQYYSEYDAWLKRCKQNLLRYKAAFSPYGLIRRLPDLKYNEGLEFYGRKYTGPHKAELEALLAKSGKQMNLYDFASKKVSHAINQGFNFPVQSAAASVTKRTMLKLNAAGYDIVTSVHDSIVIQVLRSTAKLEAEKIVKIINSNEDFGIPLVCEYKLINSLDEGDKYEI